MAISRIIYAYKTNGTTLIDPVGDGATGRIDHICSDARFHLGARQGCLGGEITLAGNVRTQQILQPGYYVEMWNGTQICYRGRVFGVGKRVEGGGHRYELRGAYSILGTPIIEAINENDIAPEAIVQDLYDTYFDGLTGIASLSKSTSSVTISRAYYNKTEGALRILEELELLAGATDLGWWVSGVTPAGVLYFKPISTSAGNLQATITVGSNAVSGNEMESNEIVANRVAILGGKIIDENDNLNAGYYINWYFDDDTSKDQYGASRRFAINLKVLHEKADLQLAANAYFARYSTREVELDGHVFHITDADTMIFPWDGQIKYVDSARGISQQVYCSQVDVEFNHSLKIAVHVGMTDSASSDHFAPSEERALDGGDTGAGGDGVGGSGFDPYGDFRTDNYPYVTEQDSPWFETPAESIDGNGDSTGLPGGGLTSRGQVLSLSMSALATDSLGAITEYAIPVATIFNGGASFGPDGSPVRFYFRQYDETDANPTASTFKAATLAYTDGNVLTYIAPSGASAQAVTPGWIRIGVRVNTAASEYKYWPSDFLGSGSGDSDASWLECPRYKVSNTDDMSSLTALFTTIIPSGWQVGS